MPPIDPTLTHVPSEPGDASEAAWDAGMAAAFGPAETGELRPAAAPETGTVLAGKFTLSELIGEGGMGSVWVAHQTEPVKRKVAVKLIKAGMDSATVLARFEAERQALAVMDHPNIAKVLDGGLTPDGRPFFVMELVKGVPITEYCDARKLTPRERLELFVPVCLAIQHAHQKGIIHRDIKPANVLVALYDDRPVPKVIDFGIAKATGGTLTEHTIETAFGGVVGTPQYMSPEQASLNNLDIDTRSDVYSLGVLLYELLTGSPPFSKNELEKRGLLEILRIVREEEPPRPSTKLSTADALPSLSASRGTEPKKLTGLLRNELDWIVMKALEKDRGRRYETANGFASDVNRYLGGEAVLAHPPSKAYRVKKFVRRNRGQVTAASLVLVALLAGIAGTTAGLIRANRAATAERIAKEDAEEQKSNALRSAEREAEERKKADAAKVEAQAKEAEANAVVKFFEEKVFEAARPKGEDGGLGAGVTLRDAVVAGVPALETGFAGQPLVEARLRVALGSTFLYLAEYGLARDQLERARALYTKFRGPDHPDTLKTMNNLAHAYDGLNRPVDAFKLREETLATQKRVLPPDDPATLKSMINLANSYDGLDRKADALKLREETLATQKRVLPKDDPFTLMSMTNLASSYADQKRHAEALKMREEVLEIQKRTLPPEHPSTLISMHNLANSYLDQKRHAEALKMHEEVLEIRKRVLPKDHPKTLASMHNLANSYAALNRHAEALKLFEEEVEIKKRVLPKDHPEVVRNLSDLAAKYLALGRDADALKAGEEMLERQKQGLPKDHPDTLGTMNHLANIYAALNRPADALKLYEETLAGQKRVFPAGHPDTLRSLLRLAEVLIKLDRGAEAVRRLDELIEEALAGQKRALPKGHPDTLQSLLYLAEALIKLDRGAEAVRRVDEFIAASPASDFQTNTEPFELRKRHFQKTGDPAGCRATAEMWEKLNRADAGGLFTAARFRGVAAAIQAKAPGPDAAKLAKADADRAMQWLQKAVQAGYKDAARLKTDYDLKALRGREDFKKLLTEVEAKAPKK